MSVGVHRGPVVAGTVGSFEIKEFTVVGRHVNLASRVEGLTRRHGKDILITEAVEGDLDPSISLAKQPPRPVKGVLGARSHLCGMRNGDHFTTRSYMSLLFWT